jgi:hypothetical protein
MLEGTHKRVPNGLRLIKRFSDNLNAILEGPLLARLLFGLSGLPLVKASSVDRDAEDPSSNRASSSDIVGNVWHADLFHEPGSSDPVSSWSARSSNVSTLNSSGF